MKALYGTNQELTSWLLCEVVGVGADWQMGLLGLGCRLDDLENVGAPLTIS